MSNASTGLRLYDLPDAIRDVELQIIEDGGELTPEVEARLEALEEAFDRKAEYIALLAREARAESVAVKEEEDRLSSRRKAAQNRERRLKDYLLASMTRLGVEKIEGQRAKVRVQASPPSFKWMGEDDAIPEAYRVVTVRPNVALVKEEYREGGTVPDGFTVEIGHHVRVW
jgi:hypothetical protein